MPYLIAKEFTFSASHVLAGLPAGHQCARLHGHNYRLRAELRGGDLTGPGFVLDYGDLKPFGDWVDTTLDHRHLNDVVDFNPTAEHLSRFLAIQLTRTVTVPPGVLARVWVSETPRTWALWDSWHAAGWRP